MEEKTTRRPPKRFEEGEDYPILGETGAVCALCVKEAKQSAFLRFLPDFISLPLLGRKERNQIYKCELLNAGSKQNVAREL